MDTLQDLLTQVYNEYTHRVFEIYEIFKDQFGEENVDLQEVIPMPDEIPLSVRSECNQFESERGKKEVLKNYVIRNSNGVCHIYVHWAHVRVTNEYDRFTELNDLWARVGVYYSGCIVDRFRLNRSNYSYLHISNGYMHSHVSSIPFSDFTIFQTPCTGSGGPINETIRSLQRNYNEDLWRLFCCELNNYVTVESIAGTPYHRLENLGKGSNGRDYENFALTPSLNYYTEQLLKDKWKDLVKEIILARKLKFAYKNGAYCLGMSLAECSMILSNIFIDWFNAHHTEMPLTLHRLLESKVLVKGIYQGGVIYGCNESNNRDYSSYLGKKVLTFKGREITLTIDGFREGESQFSYILHSSIVNFILTIVLQVINYRYGRKCATKANNSINTSETYL